MEPMIFVRERRKVEKGEKKPRFRICGVSGLNLKVYASHMRKMELDEMAGHLGAKVIVLHSGKEEKKEE